MTLDDKTHSTSQSTSGQQFTLTCNADEWQVIQLALGELLQTVRRDENLVPTIEDLLQRLRQTPPSA